MEDRYTPDMAEIKRRFPEYFEGYSAAVAEFLSEDGIAPEQVVA